MKINIKTKSKESRKKYTRFNPYDLFGEIPVTHDEITLWLLNVPKLTRDSPRFDWYVKNWHVVDKIKAIKAEFKTLDDFFLMRAATIALYSAYYFIMTVPMTMF